VTTATATQVYVNGQTPDATEPTTPAAAADSFWANAQAQARAFPLLPKWWGLTASAAIMNPAICKAQFDLYCDAMEQIGHFTNNQDRYLGGLFGIIGLVFGIVGYLQSQGTIAATGEWTFLHVLICALGGLIVGWAVGFSRKRMKWYSKAYGMALGLEHGDPIEPWRVTGIGITKMPRLTFVAEKDDYYFGSTGHAGVDQGVMLFAADQGNLLKDMYLADIMDAPVGKGAVTGITGRATRSLLDWTEQAAEFKRNMGRSVGRTLAENTMWIFFAVAIFICFLQIGSGGGISDASGISNLAQQATEQVGG